ncbi:MAG: amidohydrolase family protein [Bacteroidota bacterium]
MKIISIFVGLISLVTLEAQDLLITNVRVFDGQGVHQDTVLRIQGGRFISSSDVDVSELEGAVVIDAAGKTVLPGLINSHVHAWSKSQLKLALKAGVFALLDMHAPEASAARMRNAGLNETYAKYYSAGYAATAYRGHGTQFGYPVPVLGDSLPPEDFVAKRKLSGSDYIKIIYEPSRATLSLSQIDRLIKSAHKHDLLAVAHISNLKNALELAELKVDALVHVWDDQMISNSQLSLIKESGLFVVPTLAVHEQVKKYYSENEIENNMLEIDSICENVSRLYAAGVPILAGTDPPNLGINYGSSIYRELELLVASGLSELDALKSATSNPATYFDLKGLGRLAPGEEANFILVAGDPTTNISDIRNIESIWIQGKNIKK